MEMVRFLVDEAGADVNTHYATPALHEADGEEMIEFLLSRGADVNAVDEFGRTALHRKAFLAHVDDVNALLRAGAPLDIPDREAHTVLSHALDGVFRHCTSHKIDNRLQVLQALIRYGADWDEPCETIVDCTLQTAHIRTGSAASQAQWTLIGPAIKFAVLLWIEERDLGLETFTHIPVEDINRGLQSTQTYVRERKASKLIVCRRTICIVGPSTVGKTSFIKSVIKNDTCLEHIDDRTIGIHHFLLTFDEPNHAPPRPMMRKHQVVFSDFAGQTVYQVMHSLFFTRRTLFMVCVDLNAYSIALLKAEMLTQDDARKQHLMNEYVDQSVLSWVRIILARQPEAEFVFVCTKHDTVSSGPGVDEDEVLAHVNMMLGRVMTIVDATKKSRGQETSDRAYEPIAHLWDPRLDHCAKPNVETIVTSSTNIESVQHVRNQIEQLVMASARSYETPEKHMHVLEVLTNMKKAVLDTSIHTRIRSTFVDVNSLVERLQQVVPDMDNETAEDILRSLRDCTDILWYEDMADAKLQTTVMLDSELLIQFLKQVINHENTSETIPHAALEGKPYWRDLDAAEMLMMKRLLQQFHLAYPTTGEMAYGSDLIIAAYWKRRRHAVWEFGGEDLRLNMRGTEEESVARRVHWEFRFVDYFPDTLFDHLVVASYNARHGRNVGPDWILYRNADVAACRIVLGREPKSHRRSLHLEVVLAISVGDSDRDSTILWEIFHNLCKAFADILREYPGVKVTGSARTDRGRDAVSLSNFYESGDQDETCVQVVTPMWMPPFSVQLASLNILRTHLS